VGYVPQVDDVFAPLTVRENLEMGGHLLAGREVSQRIERVVSVFPRLGQMLTRRAGRLSGGEAMGRLLMLEPAVFLLDEPTANLAPQVAAELLTGHVRARAEAGAGVLVVEQRARAVLAISDCTYVLGGGQVLMADPRACPGAGNSPGRSSAPSLRCLRSLGWRPRGVTAAGRSGRPRPAATRPR
jgi:branched-chain amino acid transport system ATP-binding protein